MNPRYRSQDGRVWHWDANQEGYYTGDMDEAIPLDQLEERYERLSVWDEDSKTWLMEPETQEQMIRRVIREELDRRLGKAH